MLYFVGVYLCYFLKIVRMKYKGSVIMKRNLWQCVSIFILVQNFLFKMKCKYIDYTYQKKKMYIDFLNVLLKMPSRTDSVM